MTSFEKVIDLFQTSSFKENFEEYKSKNNKGISELLDFLDSIETNKKYYRIGVQKNKKYRKKQNEDTEDIKNINSLVNKITENNFIIIQKFGFKCWEKVEHSAAGTKSVEKIVKMSSHFGHERGRRASVLAETLYK